MAPIRSRLWRAVTLAGPALALALAACGQLESPAAESTLRREIPVAQLREPVAVLLCEEQPFARASQVVGPFGGTIVVGRHKLEIPAGALLTPTLISAEAPGDASASVHLMPTGLQFRKPVRLTLDYSHCPLGVLAPSKWVAYTSDALTPLSVLLSDDSIGALRITAELDHFSRYAVAW
jgi:hypothetical protein